jgi:SSS family solute:Na+ symporter
MVYGTVTAYHQTVPNTVTKLVKGQPVVETHGLRHFGSSLADFPFTSTKAYIAISALVVNLVVAVVLTVVLRALHVRDGDDETRPGDFYADVPAEAVVREAQREVAGAEPRVSDAKRP